jgi:hypothetical protein
MEHLERRDGQLRPGRRADRPHARRRASRDGEEAVVQIRAGSGRRRRDAQHLQRRHGGAGQETQFLTTKDWG